MKLFQVDSFTDRPFAGNPAAVCLLDAPADEAWMQEVAAEMNLSETAFVHPDGNTWGLRWFTPKCEVDLCGHATLAAAHVLFERGADSARFTTASGAIDCTRGTNGIEMDFPAEIAEEASLPVALGEALRVPILECWRNRLDWMLVVGQESIVRGLDPDNGTLATIDGRGFIVTARADDACEYDFVSRYFCPAVGIDEDPVTGSAHCCLGPYWAKRLGKEELVGYQASARGGIVHVAPRGDRVRLGGTAVTVFEGGLRV
ncbi:MAG: PhzF family phenazine biosynthesis protein [Planctomycetota bacterium]|jgi:predicted PhzF superfamily epimerase YddE/YHI9